MIGNVYIIGQIGSNYDDNGNLIKKGVEVIDVVQQLSSLQDAERVNVYINSEGGFVDTGRQIAELLKNVPNCFTIASELCASIATEIHLAVPLQNRLIEKGTTYMIHNPLFMGVSGDADTLKRMSESIKKTESEMESMYSKATGLSKEILSSLMQVETHLTDEQAVKLNFASKVIDKMERKAVALFNNQKSNMEKQSKSFSERLALAIAVLTGKEEVNERNALAMEIPTDKGLLVTPFEDLQVGDEAMIEGQPAPDGEYLAENGQVLVVMGGLVAEIKEMVEPENEELALLKAENESLKAQISELSTVSESALAKLEELAKKGSSYTPPASSQTFRKVEAATVESYEERKQRLYSNK
jgi:ATP-dependent protease ClpP protease subunit